MRGRLAGIIGLVAVLLLLPAVGAWAAPKAPASVRGEIAKDGSARVIVELRLDSGVFRPEGNLPGAASVAAQRRDIAGVRGRLIKALRSTAHRVAQSYETVPLLALEVDAAALERLEASPFVARVQQDSLSFPSLAESVPLIGGDQLWAQGYDGTGTVVAVLDTGVNSSHAFLAGKVVEEACYGTTVRRKSVPLCPNGKDEQIGPGAAASCSLASCEHGTHVTGIAAGNGLQAGQAFSGVARGANVMAVQVFSRFDRFADCGGLFPPCIAAYTSDVIAGLERVYLLRGTYNFAAVNMSLGGGSFPSSCDSEPYKPAIDNLRSVGIATVAASGNSGTTSSMGSPACISSVVSVASTTKSDTLSFFSSVSPVLSLLAPGDGIRSSVPGGGYSVMSGTSMAAPHVAGAWALLKQADPSASVSEILAVLQQSGKPIADTRLGGTQVKPRIQLPQALVLLSGVPFVSTITPDRAEPGATLDVTISGFNFESGALADFGAGISVTSTAFVSGTELTASISVDAAAALGPRDVVVSNPDGESGTIAGGFMVVPPPPTLTLGYLGKVRDRVGKGNAALAADGALDGAFLVTVEAGSGPRTVTELELRRTDASGIWDTAPGTTYWALGAASGLDAPLSNAANATVSFPVGDGNTFSVFAADSTPALFVTGATFRLTAHLADGSIAVVETTIQPPPPPAVLTLDFIGKVGDRVGQGNQSIAADGAPDGTFSVTVAPGSGPRTVTEIELRRTDATGIWDTVPGTAYWAVGASAGLGDALYNGSNAAVSFPVGDGSTFHLFSADTGSGLFIPGAAFRVTVRFSDGSTSVDETTIVPPPPPTLALAYLGTARDRVGKKNAAITPDGALDGTFSVTLQPGSGARTVSELELRRTDASGIWDTILGTPYWVLGAAGGLDAALYNGSNAAVSFPVADGGTFYVFASESKPALFVTGATFRLTARFSDGSTALAEATISP